MTTTAANILRARWIAPMSSPPFENGAVAIRDGRIIAVGRFHELDIAGPVTDLGDVVLMPGLINAHTHLELSNQSPGEKPASFGEWLLGIVSRRTAIAPTDFAASVANAVRLGAAECLSFGVTTVGDISRECAITRPALRDGPLRVVSFGEVQALAQRRRLLEKRIATAIDDSSASAFLSIAISPHAPYTVEPDAYRRCVAVARERNLPICTHLAETIEEADFIVNHAGPLRDLWNRLGTWDDEVPRWPGTPIDLAQATRLLDVSPLLAHVNYLSDDELDRLSQTTASVVFCPRTHAFFGHVPHRWREMLARGINVCVGTDSRASSPDLNVVDDLRLLHQQSPEVEPAMLWEMVTTRAARALRLSDVGSIEVGMRADLVAFPTVSGDPLRHVFEQQAIPSDVWVAGLAKRTLARYAGRGMG